MDQVALPYRIALVALLVVAALWFVALRPKADTGSEPATAPGVSGLANAVDQANGVAQTGTTSTPSSSSPSPSATPSTPAEELLKGVGENDPSRPLLASISKGRVAVMLFWNVRGSDDKAVRSAVKRLDLRDGKVITKIVPIADVGRYEAITRGAHIDGSPTVLVINSQGVARSIDGYTTTSEISQLVGDLGGKGF